MVNRIYGKLLANLNDKMPWNKIFVQLIGPFIRYKKVDNIPIIKVVAMIKYITECFEITKHDGKN